MLARLGRRLGQTALTALAGVTACENDEPQPLTADAIARYTLAVSSCAAEIRYLERSAFLYNPSRERTTQISAAVQARLPCFEGARSGCASLRTCLGWPYEWSSGVPCDEPPEASCEGPVSRRCLGSEGVFVRRRTNCAALGRPCENGQCVDPGRTGRACNSDRYVSRCELGSPLYCDNGVEYAAAPCAVAGLRCFEGGGRYVQGGAFCGDEGPACERRVAPDGRRFFGGLGCEGAMLRECGAGGRESLVDCGRWVAGASCQQAPAGDAAGEIDFFCGVASECNPFSATATCEGDTIVFCNGGRVERIRCSELGFGPCGATEEQAGCSLPGEAPTATASQR